MLLCLAHPDIVYISQVIGWEGCGLLCTSQEFGWENCLQKWPVSYFKTSFPLNCRSTLSFLLT